jgi:hypothetical protein
MNKRSFLLSLLLLIGSFAFANEDEPKQQPGDDKTQSIVVAPTTENQVPVNQNDDESEETEEETK